MDTKITAATFDAVWMEDIERGGLHLRVAAFDNGGETVDRYSIVVEEEPPWDQGEDAYPEVFTYHASPNPFHPQGVGMTAEGWMISDSENDVLIDFGDLPPPVQAAVWNVAGRGWLLPAGEGSVELQYDFERQHWYVHAFR